MVLIGNLFGYDIILLDLGLPDYNGIDLIPMLKNINQTPIIIISAQDKEQQKIIALDNGADDYLTKPFNAQELLARIRVGLRHQSQNTSEVETSICIKDICVDFDKHRVFNQGEEVHLTPIEYEILSLLVRNHGKVLTHHFILKNIWGSQSLESDIQTLRVTMANLRRKIEMDPAQPQYILTEIGVGYRFLD